METSLPIGKFGTTLLTWTSVQFDPPSMAYRQQKASTKKRKRLDEKCRSLIASKKDVNGTRASHKKPIKSVTLGLVRASDVSVIVFASPQRQHPTVPPSTFSLTSSLLSFNVRTDDRAENSNLARSRAPFSDKHEVPVDFWHIPPELQASIRHHAIMAGGYRRPELSTALQHYLTGFPNEEDSRSFDTTFLRQLLERGTAFCKGFHTVQRERLRYQQRTTHTSFHEEESIEELRRTTDSFWPATLPDELEKLLVCIPALDETVTALAADIRSLAHSGATSVCLLHASLYWRTESLHPFFRTQSCHSEVLTRERLLDCLLTGSTGPYQRICDSSLEIQNFGLTFLEVLVATLVTIVNPTRKGLARPFHVSAVQAYLVRVLSRLLTNRLGVSATQISSLVLTLSELDALAASISALYE